MTRSRHLLHLDLIARTSAKLPGLWKRMHHDLDSFLI
jgi:hypothetical protein